MFIRSQRKYVSWKFQSLFLLFATILHQSRSFSASLRNRLVGYRELTHLRLAKETDESPVLAEDRYHLDLVRTLSTKEKLTEAPFTISVGRSGEVSSTESACHGSTSPKDYENHQMYQYCCTILS